MLVLPPVCRKSKSIVLLLAITAIAAAGLFAGLSAGQARAEDDNQLPAIATPSNTFIAYLFPKDTAGKLTFPTAPVIDPDAAADKPPTVKFTFKFDDADATELAKKPDEMLLAVHFDETNHTYAFSKSGAYTIEKYRDVYNTTGAQTTLDGTMTADDGTDTAELSFTLTVQHDASAQFQTPATHQSNNRWQVSTTYEVYEGPGAADAISLAWQASTPDAKRSWYADIDSESPIKCYDGSSSTATTVSGDWPESADDLLFSVSNTTDDTATIPSGTLSIAFKADPDFGNPQDDGKDHVYTLRIVNDHETALPDADKDELGCSGSALDISVKVKDVGPPAPPTGLKLKNVAGKIDIDWDSPAPNQFMEDGQLVDFPHSSFNTQLILLENEPATLTFPWHTSHPGETFVYPYQLESRITGIQNVRGVAGETYTIKIRYKNSEGISDPISATITIPGPPETPAKPTVTANSATSVNVAWDAPNSNDPPITGYSVQYRVKDTVTWKDVTHSGTGRTATIARLQPSTTYEAQVKATSANSSSAWSPTGEGSTETFNVTLELLFPRGEEAVLELDGPLIEVDASDTDPITHAFTFKKPDDENDITPASALLTVSGPDTDDSFTIAVLAGTTPAQFRDAYGATSKAVALSATLSASHSDQTVNRTFTLNITYDDSPQFGEPADYGSNNRWTVAYETYEGLTDLTGISLPWTAVTDGTRQWSPGTPTSITPKCRDHDGDTSANWPAAGSVQSRA